MDDTFDSSRALVVSNSLRDSAKNSKHESACACRWVSQRDGRSCEACMEIETVAAERFIRQRNHWADHFRRCVVATRLLAQVVVGDRKKRLVEVKPRIRLAFADLVPIDCV